MEQSNLETIYNMVCNAPKGTELSIDYMPDFFLHDTMDNDSPHVHTFYEIIWFREAGGIHTVDFKEYPIEKDMLFFLSPGQVHFFDHAVDHKGILIMFCTDFLKEEHTDEDIYIKYNLFNAFDSQPYCTINEETAQHLLSVLHKLEEEQLNESLTGHVDMLRSLTKIFLVLVHRHCEKSSDHTLSEKKSSHRLFIMFRKTLEQQYMRKHTVKEYADSLNVSTKTLSNYVIESSGKTPLTFINDRITLEAKRLLRFSNMMVKEIADYLGFEDSSYFVKFFKRQTGHLPSAFREQEDASI
jgi:AraC-like DNA-binding protein